MNWYKRQIITAGIQPESKRDLIQIFEELGFQFMREGGGDHQIWTNPYNNRQTVIPDGPGNRIINPKTMERMLKDLGITLKIFNDYRELRKNKKYRKSMPEFLTNFRNSFQPQEQKTPLDPNKFNPEDFYKRQQWYIDQQKYKDKTASQNKSAQSFQIQISSYNQTDNELNVLFNGRGPYTYPNVSPFAYKKIETFLKYKNHRKAKQFLDNLVKSRREQHTDAEKQEMLDQLYNEGHLS